MNMKNMYAVKCLYKADFYNKNGDLLENIIPGWEERIILLNAASMEEADIKSEKYAKDYEHEYVNVDNQIVKVKLYTIIDIYAIFDTNSRTNIEVYSNIFNASKEEVEEILDIQYPIKK